jgi:hypothetical protein
MARARLTDKLHTMLDRHIHMIVICVLSFGFFAFIMIMNPVTLVWLGIKQLDCDLRQHSKCAAPRPLSAWLAEWFD